jgi:hypothetical protein
VKKKLLFVLSVLLTSLILVAAGWAAVHLAFTPRPAIPATVRDRLEFTPFVLKPDGSLTADAASYKYDASQKGFSFVAHNEDGVELTISQQATPQSFIDIPDLYSKLVDNMGRYGAFDNQLGTVYLTRPKDQATGQTGVINAKGVLMFVRSSKDLQESQWRRSFQSFALED